MLLNKEPKTSEVLVKAKELLETDQRLYICTAYSDAYSDITGLRYSSDHEFRREIENLLGGDPCEPRDYRQWLSDEHGIEVITEQDREKLKQSRINWVAHLIEEYKSKGD